MAWEAGKTMDLQGNRLHGWNSLEAPAELWLLPWQNEKLSRMGNKECMRVVERLEER